MGDENTSVEQVQTPPQQANVDWKVRFDGQVRKIEELTLRNRELEGQLTQKTSENEQLRAQLSLKDTEKTAAVGERDKTIQELTTAKTGVESELTRLRGLEMKVKVAKEMGRPDLIAVLDTIPNMSDEAALKTVLTTLSSYADTQVRAREQQLLSGVTPPVTPGASAAKVPSSAKEWEAYINGLPLGSKERAKAMDDQWDWLVAQNSK